MAGRDRWRDLGSSAVPVEVKPPVAFAVYTTEDMSDKARGNAPAIDPKDFSFMRAVVEIQVTRTSSLSG